MSQPDYVKILGQKYAGSEWTLNGDTYDGLTWLSDTPKPTQAELDALWLEVQNAVERDRIESLRKTAYATESDPVFFQYQRGDATEQEWLDAVEAVKAKYPYPA